MVATNHRLITQQLPLYRHYTGRHVLDGTKEQEDFVAAKC